MNTTPLVSVIMPAYNASRWISTAIRSVHAQHWRPLELVVVDDGSTDSTAQTVSALAEELQDPDFRIVLVSQPNAGQSHAVNRGLAVAHGVCIKFFDADDLLTPGLIAAQMARLAGATDSVACAECHRFNTQPGDVPQVPAPVRQDVSGIDWLVQTCGEGLAMMQCAMWLVPRPLLERVGGWDPQLNVINDYEFFTRLLAHTRDVRWVEGEGVHYRNQWGSSLSGRTGTQALLSMERSIARAAAALAAVEDSARTRKIEASAWFRLLERSWPEDRGLTARIEQRLRVLGWPKLRMQGGRIFHWCRPVLGWKLARCLEQALQTLRRAHPARRTDR